MKALPIEWGKPTDIEASTLNGCTIAAHTICISTCGQYKSAMWPDGAYGYFNHDREEWTWIRTGEDLDGLTAQLQGHKQNGLDIHLSEVARLSGVKLQDPQGLVDALRELAEFTSDAEEDSDWRDVEDILKKVSDISVSALKAWEGEG